MKSKLKNKFPNVAIIMKMHYNTNCFRVDVKRQRGPKRNVILVTCSPQYNGIYEYDPKLCSSFEKWKNKSITCYCVPYDCCKYLGPLEDLYNMDNTKDLISDVKKQQKSFVEGEVENNKEYKNQKPDWMLK